jgi:hypothetical protein
MNDHDLLVRIDEKVASLRAAIDSSLLRIDAHEKDIGSLQMTRAQVYAITAFISSASGILIKLFWK